MTAHKHAQPMAEYAKDALETDKPWERWESYSGYDKGWWGLASHPAWADNAEYRRKRVPLCQVEGKNVFPGDKLWYTFHKIWITVSDKHEDENYVCCPELGLVNKRLLSWTEPLRTKTMYQWAVKNDRGWLIPMYFCADEKEVRTYYKEHEYPEIRRLDYTALEVPA